MSQVIGTLLSSLGRLVMIAAITAAFGVGLAGTVYLSLRSPEVEVPDIVSKNRFDGETTLKDAGLNVRVRASRFKADAKPGTILDQSPRAGEVVKVGQTIAVVLSRAPKEGEAPVGQDNDPDDAADAESNGGTSSGGNVNKNDNQNRAQRNKNSNRNIANKNVNKNAANQNVGNRNANGNRNTNANRNGNVANRNANQNTNNRNAARNVANANRRVPAAATPPANPAGNRP